MLNSYNLTKRIAFFLRELKTEYIKIHNNISLFKKEVFAEKVLNVLKNNQVLLAYLSDKAHEELRESLTAYKERCLRLMTENNSSQKQIEDFKAKINVISNKVSKQKLTKGNKAKIIDGSVIEIIDNIFKKIRTIFADGNYSDKTIYHLLALSISLDLPNLELKDQYILFNLLLSVRELWVFGFNKLRKLNNNLSRYEFLMDTSQVLKIENDYDSDKIFAKMINYLVKESAILESLSDKELLALYERLKDYEQKSNLISVLLADIHNEAGCRYNYRRLSDSGYELLKRFRSCDNIRQHIDNTEYSIVQSYLLQKETFINQVTFIIAKQVDNIKALNITKCAELSSLLNSINVELSKKIHLEKAITPSLSSIRTNLDKNLEAHIQKRYLELDEYLVKCLQNRYKILFYNIQNLIEEKNGYLNYLKRVLAGKTAMDYYITNLSNSATKFRAITKDRESIISLIEELNIEQIFIGARQNKITSLSFRKKLTEDDFRSPIDYVSGIIREIVILCDASQLEILCAPLLNGKLSRIQTVLKKHISNQIHQRISIRNMFYSIFSGRKREYDKLSEIKKHINQSLALNDPSYEKIESHSTKNDKIEETFNSG